MKELINKFFSLDLPIQKQLLNLTAVLGGISAFILGSLSLFLNQGWKTSLLAYCCFAVAVITFIVGNRTKKTTLVACAHIIVQNLIIFPILHISTTDFSPEFIVYYIIGFAYTAILLEGWLCVLFLVIEFVVYLSVIYYVMVIKWMSLGAMITIDSISYLRVVVAFLATGLICGIIVSYRRRILNIEMQKKEEVAEEAKLSDYAKDMFLVNVSHEIRTPLNAIVGTAELLLDDDSNEVIYENAYHALNAGKALLAITNDLLDFSRMEGQKLGIFEEKYDVAEMFNEIASVTAIRQLDKNMQLYMDIDPQMPKALVGDDKKIRQVFQSLINNTNKNMNGGSIYVQVTFEEKNASFGDLKVEIRNTRFEEMSGLEEQEDLFFEIELCRNIIEAMGGSLRIEKETGTMSFELKQDIADNSQLASYQRPFKGLMFTANCLQDKEQFLKVFSRLRLELIMIPDADKFIELGKSEEYTHIFINLDCYEALKKRIDEELDIEKVCIISKFSYSFGENFYGSIINRPFTCLNLVAYLENGKNYAVRKMSYRGEFSCPNAYIMVVDDNEVNLDVADEMIRRYGANVIRAASGTECIKLLSKEAVDLIFMDYMMPEMDGIDTLKRIREIDDINISSIPIVALTANAVSGAREMFLEAGFQEYISKPIERDKLEHVLLQLLPEEIVIKVR